jgi:hypothetical protein
MQQRTLTVPPKKLFARAEWLRHSVGWTLACVAGWYLLNAVLEKLFGTYGAWFGSTLIGTAIAAHLLIWYKAVLSSIRTVTEPTEPVWLSMASAGWLLVLLLFQLASLALLFLVFVIGANGGIMG